jgi:hypothetical protein
MKKLEKILIKHNFKHYFLTKTVFSSPFFSHKDTIMPNELIRLMKEYYYYFFVL